MKPIKFVSKGVYSIQEAARLLGEQSNTIRRWAFGYRRSGTTYAPAIRTELPRIDGEPALTFRELVQLMYIQGFLKTGASWPKVRGAAETASRLFNTDHPFAMRKWFADPGGIYALMHEADGAEGEFVELAGAGQTAMRSTLAIYLEQLDFDIEGHALRWFPLGKAEPVVLDPAIDYGLPTVVGTRVETSLVAEMYRGAESVDEIAWWYSLTPEQVFAAVRFEEKVAAAA